MFVRLSILFALLAVAFSEESGSGETGPELSVEIVVEEDDDAPTIETTWEGTANTRLTVSKRRVWRGQIETSDACTSFATSVPKSKSAQYHTPTKTCEIFSSEIAELKDSEKTTDTEYSLFMRIDTVVVEEAGDDSLSGSEIAATIVIAILIVIAMVFCIYMNWGHEEEDITAQMEEIEKAEQEIDEAQSEMWEKASEAIEDEEASKDKDEQ
eukprot:TRINITY_DN3408_c0_g1_i7.p1 TRINITY_DN3408_c0_g1~~TRINITY_DN3408_c0_g1_i7.p1  ORF type:complete len:212 (+),score=70.23 TRINITY_DN3408_c0_g1_i7:79-714(+)